MAKQEMKVVPSSREVIEGKLLAAMDDKAKVAVVFSHADLDRLIDCLNYNTPRWNDWRRELRHNLIELRRQVFEISETDSES